MKNKKIIKRLLDLKNDAETEEGKQKIHNSINRKLSVAKNAKALLDKVKVLYQYFRDPTTSKSKKAIIGAGLLYFIIPTDVVSDFIPFLGYVDDGIAIAYVWSLLEKELNDYEKGKGLIDITPNAEHKED